MSTQSKLPFPHARRRNGIELDKAAKTQFKARDRRASARRGANASPTSPVTQPPITWTLAAPLPASLMDASFDLPDSTDWISTALPEFEPLEAALRCEVCKEFYTNPVITSCSHTFCSICIRRCIAADGKCPSCKTGCSSDKLAPNLLVREVVTRFQEARPKALELARADKEDALEQSNGKKRKLDETDMVEDGNVRQTRSRQAKSRTSGEQGTDDAPIQVLDSEDDGDGDFVPEGMANCPICRKQMKAEQVYNHLDTCPGPDGSQGRSTRSRAKPAFPPALRQRQREPSPPPTRLSQLNYAMLKETALRKKLQDIGIPAWGSKDLMKRRHIEWLNIYNANCDASDSVRKNKRQLLKELDVWEQTQGGKADVKENKIMKKDFDGGGYAKSHKSEFDSLIAQARQKRVAKKIDEGEEDDKAGAGTDVVNSGSGGSTHDVEVPVSNSIVDLSERPAHNHGFPRPQMLEDAPPPPPKDQRELNGIQPFVDARVPEAISELGHCALPGSEI